MIRGFLSGAFWGTAVAVLGLGTVSQLTPLPVARISADASAVPRAKPAPQTPAAVPDAKVQIEPEKPVEAPIVDEVPVPATPDPSVAAPVPEDEGAALDPPRPAAPASVTLDPPAGSEFAKPLPDVVPVLPKAEASPRVPTVAAAPLTPLVSDTATKTDVSLPAPSTGTGAPEALDPPVEAELADARPATETAAKIPLVVPEKLALPLADAAPVPAEAPAPSASPEEPDVLLKPLPEVVPVPETKVPEAKVPALPVMPVPEPEVILVPDTGPVAEDPALKSAATLEPTPGLKGTVDGVTTGRLPRIGDAPVAGEGAAVPATEAGPEATADATNESDDDLPPLKKYARTFENPDEKPLFSIILIDTGGADIDRDALAALPFAVTFALDPLAAGVAEASKIYRDAGQEVIMVATGIPAGATAADLEVTFQAHAAALPEAVAVIDTEFGAFQADRPLATQVVPILKAQGRGLISWDRGLNAADQVARREGLASGMVFRKLDGKGENTAAVRRALDRAAFKAAQDGRVLVIGQTLPSTVAALMEWAIEGRAASVALAPVSAVLQVQ